MALLEAADVDQSGGDDRARLDGGDPRQRQEDATAPGHLDDQAHRPRLPAYLDQDDDVVDLAHRIPEGVEDGRAHEAGDEDP